MSVTPAWQYLIPTKTTGLDTPIWEYVGSNGFKLDYFELGVTTASNNLGISAGRHGMLDLWVVSTTAGALPSLNQASWSQYSDLYNQMIIGLQSSDNGHIGADLLANSLGLGSDLGSHIGSPSATAIQNEYLAITRTFLPLDEATTIATVINGSAQTEIEYVDGLLSQVASTAIPALAVEATMYGASGSSAEITSLTTQFLPPQVAYAIHVGLTPQVYASEALGLAFAFGNETGSSGFATAFGPSSASMPNSAVGDSTFAAAAATAIFGSAASVNTPIAIEGWVTNWKTFYSANGLPGNLHPTADQVDLAARATAWGDAVGVALVGKLGPLYGQATNFLDDAAQGIATYGASLIGQPSHHPFEGEL